MFLIGCDCKVLYLKEFVTEVLQRQDHGTFFDTRYIEVRKEGNRRAAPLLRNFMLLGNVKYSRTRISTGFYGVSFTPTLKHFTRYSRNSRVMRCADRFSKILQTAW